MLTVGIFINGNPLVAKNAINTGKLNDKGETGYLCDDGTTVWHHPEDGAVILAHKLLELIRNDEPKKRTKR